MSNFRVLLVYPNMQMVNLLPSNISILSACLKKAGFNVDLFDTTKTEEKSVDDGKRPGDGVHLQDNMREKIQFYTERQPLKKT